MNQVSLVCLLVILISFCGLWKQASAANCLPSQYQSDYIVLDASRDVMDFSRIVYDSVNQRQAETKLTNSHTHPPIINFNVKHNITTTIDILYDEIHTHIYIYVCVCIFISILFIKYHFKPIPPADSELTFSLSSRDNKSRPYSFSTSSWVDPSYSFSFFLFSFLST